MKVADLSREDISTVSRSVVARGGNRVASDDANCRSPGEKTRARSLNCVLCPYIGTQVFESPNLGTVHQSERSRQILHLL